MASRCPQCGKQFDEDRGFCPFDGARLDGDLSGYTKESAAPDFEAPGYGYTESLPGHEIITATASTKPRKVIEVVSALNAPSVTAALEQLGPIESEYDKLLGTVLDGRYEIQRKLGEGGMGVVFLAKHIVIEKMVAVKVLKREVARDQSVVKRFVQEAKAASRIGHPNIVDVTDFGTTADGMTYSVMEYVEGDTLSQVVKGEAPLSPSRALPIVAQLAKALSSAHEKGIVHRDLKPDNVFVIARDGRRDFVKIVDFGIAKIIPIEGRNENAPRLTHAGSVFGTAEYMAPEQAAGRSDTDHRVDIYSLGVMLYEMLLGEVPHKGDTMVRTLAMQMLDEIPHPRQIRPDIDLGEDLEQVLLKALAKKRAERFQSMYELLVHLERVSDGVPLSQPLSPSAQLVRTAAPPGARTLVPPPLGSSSSATAPGSDSSAGTSSSGQLAENSNSLNTIPTVSEPVLSSAPTQSISAKGASQAAPTDPEPEAASIGAAAPDAGSPGRMTSLEKPRTAKKNQMDPAFVRRKRPLSFEALYQQGDTGEASHRERRRRWPLALTVLLILGAGVAAAAVIAVQREKSSQGQATELAGSKNPVSTDPGSTTSPTDPVNGHSLAIDAAPAADAVVQTATSGAKDAGPSGDPGSKPGSNPGSRPGSKPGSNDKPPVAAPSRRLEIKVLTKPDGATLYINKNYTGQSGTNIRRAEGTKLTVECRLPGYKPGKVQVQFDGINEVYICRLGGPVNCVKGLKNPFADCPE